jgi:LysR family glycine cleavage system transcriptional activator
MQKYGPVRLPSINQLRAFEAAARHLSFTAAARELALTQAAVSLRVQNLEGRLGARLFERGRRLMLTQVGRLYLHIVTDVLTRLEAGTNRVLDEGKLGLRMLVTQAVASQWLIPRLNAFNDRNRSIRISIVNLTGPSTAIGVDDFVLHNADAAIVNSPSTTKWPGLAAEEIIGDYSVSVCSPAIAAAERDGKIDLRRHALIHTERWPHAWPQWLTAMGTPNLRPRSSLWLNNTGLSVQAAMSSLGWTIAHGPLVADDILSGRLAAPFRTFLPNEFSYFILTPLHNATSAPVVLFRDWFSSEIRNSLAELRLNGFDIPAIPAEPERAFAPPPLAG